MVLPVALNALHSVRLGSMGPPRPLFRASMVSGSATFVDAHVLA